MPYIALTVALAARGCCSRLWKNLQHALWHNNYTLALLPATYRTLVRVPLGARSAHLSISLAKSSRPLKANELACITMDESLRQANSGDPNSNTDMTNELIIYNLTLQFDNPSS